jgi:rhodanese-related sulfurtransferase
MPQPGPAGYYDLSPDRLAEMLAQGDEFALVNVHIPYAGEIAGTDAHIPYNEISDYLDRLPGQEDVIVLYCRSGPMSITAAKTLVQQGYTNVWELNGGMVAWTAAGYELVNE